MNRKFDFQIYSGEGRTDPETVLDLPPYQVSPLFDDPRLYVAKKGLSDAVNIGLLLGQPLLVTGEPGTGKTQLAYSIAQELGNLPIHRFNTKSTSTAKDFFYRYDALRHFHDAQLRRSKQFEIQDNKAVPDDTNFSAERYITFEALGLAILLSLPPDNEQRYRVNKYLPEKFRDIYNARSVVLIDEIDKAPRDLPNDILNEIEDMSFEVKEIDAPPFVAEKKNRPIVILTSNSEKNLPDAFLRRCVFYHIEFPDTEELKRIVNNRLGRAEVELPPDLRDNAIYHFERIRRELKLKKPPATAELLAWIQVLERMKLDIGDHFLDEEALIFTYSILTKSNEDTKAVIEKFHSGYYSGDQN